MGWQTVAVPILLAGNTIINSSGVFTYSGAPAAGNLIASQTPASGTDQFGNIYLQGISSYESGFANTMLDGTYFVYSGTLSGGWSQLGSLAADVSGDFISTFTGSFELSGNLTASTINGSSNTGTGLPAGVPTGGPNGGVFAGHTHDFDGHTHAI